MIRPIYGIKIASGPTPWVLNKVGTTRDSNCLGDGSFATLDINLAYEVRFEMVLKYRNDGGGPYALQDQTYTVEER